MQRNLLFFLACSLLLYNCKNDDSLPEPELPTAAEYTQLAIGNYWVYQWYNVNLETGEITATNKTDSIYIAKDSLINGETYYIMEGTRFSQAFRRVVRNDGNELVNAEDKTLLSTQVTSDTVAVEYDVIANVIDSVITVLNQSVQEVETPNGVFTSDFQYERTYYMNPNFTQHDFKERFETDFYVKGIGVVLYSGFWSSTPTDVQARLLRYHLN